MALVAGVEVHVAAADDGDRAAIAAGGVPAQVPPAGEVERAIFYVDRAAVGGGRVVLQRTVGDIHVRPAGGRDAAAAQTRVVVHNGRVVGDVDGAAVVPNAPAINRGGIAEYLTMIQRERPVVVVQPGAETVGGVQGMVADDAVSQRQDAMIHIDSAAGGRRGDGIAADSGAADDSHAIAFEVQPRAQAAAVNVIARRIPPVSEGSSGHVQCGTVQVQAATGEVGLVERDLAALDIQGAVQGIDTATPVRAVPKIQVAKGWQVDGIADGSIVGVQFAAVGQVESAAVMVGGVPPHVAVV